MATERPLRGVLLVLPSGAVPAILDPALMAALGGLAGRQAGRQAGGQAGRRA